MIDGPISFGTIRSQGHLLSFNRVFGQVCAGTTVPDTRHVGMAIQHRRRRCTRVPPCARLWGILRRKFWRITLRGCRRDTEKSKHACDGESGEQETFHFEPPYFVGLFVSSTGMSTTNCLTKSSIGNKQTLRSNSLLPLEAWAMKTTFAAVILVMVGLAIPVAAHHGTNISYDHSRTLTLKAK